MKTPGVFPPNVFRQDEGFCEKETNVCWSPVAQPRGGALSWGVDVQGKVMR